MNITEQPDKVPKYIIGDFNAKVGKENRVTIR